MMMIAPREGKRRGKVKGEYGRILVEEERNVDYGEIV